ncbi:MAG TPA: Ig-like domain-containing protein, partial [Gemmatimonadales bacterium]|nr:Ig-like domain-containing protein [Gemmatimonadales bacterium]
MTCTTNPLGATNGVAAFAGCRINNAGNGYRLSATANVGGNTFTVNSDLFNVVANNAAPNAPATLAQFRSNGTTSIPTGGATNETSVVLKGVVSDPDAGNTVKLQVEVKPVGTAFADVATAESALLASGSTASVTVGSLVNGTSYHWQARAVDNNGAASAPWTSFGGNLESAADFSVDTDAPGVTINQAAAQADPTSGSTINFTVVFSKSVTGFATGDVTLSGTAGATTATVTGSGTTYNVAVSGMTTDGTVIATIAAGVATDAAGNANVASTSTDNTVTYDTTKPTVTINQAATQADPTNASPINFTVEFSEIVTGFATGDVTLSGTAGATTATVSGSGTTYNVAVTGMTTDGTVIATIGASVAIDAAGNANLASTSTDNSVTYDKTPPTVTINQAAAQTDPTSASPINFTVVFSEIVTDFATGDVTVSGTAGATIGTVTGSGTTYNVAVSDMTNGGTVIAAIGAGKATDAAGNGNTASTSTDNTVTYDPVPPVVSNVAVSPNPTNGTIAVTATAKVDDATTGNSKIVSAFYSIDGGAAVAMAASDGSFNSATENVTANIPAAVVAALTNGTHQVCVKGTDAAGNSSDFSDAGACATLTVDKEPPVVSNVAVSPSPTNGTIAVTATAHVTDATTGNSKIVSAFYSIDGGAAIAMAASDGSFSSATENVTATIPAAVVAALSNGTHQVCVKGTDAAGNTSSFADAGACATLTVDKEPPVVSNVAVDPNPTNGSIDVTATATVDDAATGNSDVVSAVYSIDGGPTHPMTASDGSFNSATENVTATIPAATVAALTNGNHTVCVRGTDAAGNTSLFTAADACTTLIIDKEPPVVSNVAVSPSPTNGTIAVTATAHVTDVTTGNSKIVSA